MLTDEDTVLYTSEETESKYVEITDEFNDINDFLQTTLDAINKEHETENKILDDTFSKLDNFVNDYLKLSRDMLIGKYNSKENN